VARGYDGAAERLLNAMPCFVFDPQLCRSPDRRAELTEYLGNYRLGTCMEDRAMTTRQRIRHTTTFEERLAEEAKKLKAAAEKQPLGRTAREQLLRRARQAEMASHINDWLTSPGLQPPKALENLFADQKR
jgi:hypothetical protein